jgi:hypothetical protein
LPAGNDTMLKPHDPGAQGSSGRGSSMGEGAISHAHDYSGIQVEIKGDHWGAGGPIENFTSHPSDKDRADAEKTLENRMSKLIPEADREAMKAMTTALTNGDSKAFGEAVKKAGGDPEKLKALVSEVDKMLEDKGSSTRLAVTADGKVLVSDANRSTALAFDPKTGAAEAKAVETNMDGSVLVKPGELLHVDQDKAFKDMSEQAVNAVNGKPDFVLEKPSPFNPFKPDPYEPEPLFPHKPFFPQEPHIKLPPDWFEKLGGGSHVELLDDKGKN